MTGQISTYMYLKLPSVGAVHCTSSHKSNLAICFGTEMVPNLTHNATISEPGEVDPHAWPHSLWTWSKAVFKSRITRLHHSHNGVPQLLENPCTITALFSGFYKIQQSPLSTVKVLKHFATTEKEYKLLLQPRAIKTYLSMENWLKYSGA